MPIIQFGSIEAFDAWHETIKAQLGLPKLSVDADGNEIPDSVLITDYTKPVIKADDDVQAFVEDEYAEGLTVVDEALAL